jgi:SAM-dependent methyltransferase
VDARDGRRADRAEAHQQHAQPAARGRDFKWWSHERRLYHEENRMFFRKPTVERLPVAMTGARMGERILQIGVDDPALVGALAAKVGLSGTATAAVADESSAARVRAGASAAGALIEVHVTALHSLPFPDDAFDLVVVHAMRGLGMLQPHSSAGILQESRRVLRRGGRLVAIEPGPVSGLKSLVRRPQTATEAEALGALQAAGFRPVRVVGEREGFRFTEGIKT